MFKKILICLICCNCIFPADAMKKKETFGSSGCYPQNNYITQNKFVSSSFKKSEICYDPYPHVTLKIQDIKEKILNGYNKITFDIPLSDNENRYFQKELLEMIIKIEEIKRYKEQVEQVLPYIDLNLIVEYKNNDDISKDLWVIISEIWERKKYNDYEYSSSW